jgi:O-methyltransferase involved in polyketide biosynthesis
MPKLIVVILCEGLLGYLTFEQKQKVFANVREMLQMYGGVWITSDLDTLDNLKQVFAISSEFQQLIRTVRDLTGSSIGDRNFTSTEHIEQFASDRGFLVEICDLSDLSEHLSCLQSLEISTDLARTILACSSVCILSLKN